MFLQTKKKSEKNINIFHYFSQKLKLLAKIFVTFTKRTLATVTYISFLTKCALKIHKSISIRLYTCIYRYIYVHTLLFIDTLFKNKISTESQ